MDPKEPPDKKKPDFADNAAEGRANIRLVIPPPPERWEENLKRPGFNLSDRWLAQCVYDKHCNDFRYASVRGAWLFYNGRFWEDDPEGNRLQGRISDLLAHEAFNAVARKLKDKMRLGSVGCHGAVKSHLKDMLGCLDHIFDSDVMLLNCPSGTYDARDGKMRDHDWADFITKMTLADPAGECPLWRRHIKFVTCGDKDGMTTKQRLIADDFARYLKALAGYALFGAGREQIIPFIYGDTNNGKSTFLRAMATACGGYGIPDFPAEALMVSNRNQHREILTMLTGGRFAISTEVPDEAQWNMILLKKLSGNEQITANKMFQNSTTFLWSGVLALAGNSAPSFKSIDGAVKRRMQVIPFDAHVEAEDRDKHIDDKLKAEAGGILRWMIEGYQIYLDDGGLKMPEAVRVATEEYIASQDNIKEWVDEFCQTNPGFTELTPYKALYASYHKYCEDNNLPAITKNKLVEVLRRMKFVTHGTTYQLVDSRSITVRGFTRIVLRQNGGSNG